MHTSELARHQNRVVFLRYNLDLRRVFGVVNTPVYDHAKPNNNVYSPLTISGIKEDPKGLIFMIGERRPDIVARLCMVVDWCIDHPEYTAKIKVVPKKDYPILMPCEF